MRDRDESAKHALSKMVRCAALLWPRRAPIAVALLVGGCFVSIPELRERANPGAGGAEGAAGVAGAPGEELPARCSRPTEQAAPRRAFPEDAGLVDVTAAPYLAKGDGVTDDTQALQRAISDHVGTGRILFLPAGTYLVSDTLDALDAKGVPQPSITLQGAGREQTLIQLSPGAAGFDDPAALRAVVKLRATKDKERGLRNHVMDLHIDVGPHRGAIALDFVGHNRSGVENVTLSAPDGAGALGLRLERPWAGSRLIRNLRVEGFDVGISVAQEKFGNTFEHIELAGQRRYGFVNDRSFTVVRDLRSTNLVPVVHNTHALGMIVLVEAQLTGGSPDQTAITSEGELFVRDLSIDGYGSSIQLRGLQAARGNVAEFTSREPAHLAGQGTGSLGLPIEETPEPEPPALDDWQSVTALGAIPGDALDDTSAIQAALASGARAVYFPFGEYLVSKTLAIPASVSLLFGAESTLRFAAGGGFSNSDGVSTPVPLFEIAAGSAPLRVERFLFVADGKSELGVSLFDHAAPRDLTLALLEGEHLAHWPQLYRAEPEAGRVFFQNVHAGAIKLAAGQQAWLRACNFEADQPMIDNPGGSLWALGLKSYTPHTLIASRAGAKTELLGAFLLPEPAEAQPQPAFIVDDADASLVFATYTDLGGTEYPIHVRETRAGQTLELLPGAERVLGSGSYVPLFVGHDNATRSCE